MIYLIPLPYYDYVSYDNPAYYQRRRIIPPPLTRYGSPDTYMIPPNMLPNGETSSDDMWLPSLPPPGYLPYYGDDFPDPAGGEVQIIPLD